jgi:hypothetical protein
MNRLNVFYLVLAGPTLSVSAQTTAFAQAAASEPKTSIEWSSRASDRMRKSRPEPLLMRLEKTSASRFIRRNFRLS